MDLGSSHIEIFTRACSIGSWLVLSIVKRNREQFSFLVEHGLSVAPVSGTAAGWGGIMFGKKLAAKLDDEHRVLGLGLSQLLSYCPPKTTLPLPLAQPQPLYLAGGCQPWCGLFACLTPFLERCGKIGGTRFQRWLTLPPGCRTCEVGGRLVLALSRMPFGCCPHGLLLNEWHCGDV